MTTSRTGGAGLTSTEAALRLAQDGPNELPAARRRNLLEETWQVVRQPMLLLLVVAGTLNFLLAEPLDGALLMSFVVVVIAISIYQEHKTENALAALRDLSSPRALVIRDGQQLRIPGREVVRGDQVLLSEGDRVPADAVLLESTNLSVDESALTGESVPVRKVAPVDEVDAAFGVPGGEATPWLFSGTLVVKGHARAVVHEIGAGTELGRIGTALNAIQPERTVLQREIDRLVQVIAVLGCGAAALVVVVYGLTRGNWLEGLLAGVATTMAMLPEEFPVVLTVFLALGAWRMSRKHVLTRRPPVVETLGSVTVLCVDKTGTLTTNSMVLRELIAAGRALPAAEVRGSLPHENVLEYAALASPTRGFDPMDRAFTSLAAQLRVGVEDRPRGILLREYPLSERLLAVTHVWSRPGDSTCTVAAKGAPEAIATLCSLSAAQHAAMTADVETATAQGLRVLAVARADYPADRPVPEDPRDLAFEFLGLAALQDPLRPGVADAVAECARAGVRTVMITGDYPGTALAIGREAGLDTAAGAITGPDLAVVADEDLGVRIRGVNVFARMVPEQKLRLVRALKADGEIVGMTGDGVNDAPALRAADIGIAMGLRGTDVARESAGLVITDDDFTSIVAGIRQGRGIFDNMRKAMSYVIAVHVPIVGMALVPVFVADWPLVLLPVQIAFLQLIVDPACSIVFEVEEIDPRVMNQPPRAVHAPLFPRRVLLVAATQGLSVFAGVFAVYLWSVLGGNPDPVTRSLTFATLVLSNLALILVNRSWRLSVWRTFRQRRNPAMPWILGGAVSLLVAVLSVPVTRRAFHLGTLEPGQWGVAVLVSVLGVAWFEVYKLRFAEGP